MLRLPTAALHRLAADAPTTHELGGHFRMDAQGNLADTIMFEGQQCRDEHGNRLSGSAQCRIHKPDAPVSFHTHPKSNRPSSADMRNAVLKHPALSHKGQRRLSIIIAPRGVWWYTPSPAMRAAWKAALRRGDKSLIKDAMRLWSRTGNRLIRNKDNEDPHAFCAFMRDQGMHIHYIPYAQLPGQGHLLIHANGGYSSTRSLAQVQALNEGKPARQRLPRPPA